MKSYRNVDAVASDKNNFRDNIGKKREKNKELRVLADSMVKC